MSHDYIWRAGHREAAVDLLARARHGAAPPLLIVGEPGAGKTSLLTQISAEAEHAGFRSLVAGADVVDRGVPYAPLLAVANLDSRVDEASAIGSVAHALRDAIDTSPPTGDTPEHRAGVLELARRFLAALAFRGPVLLAFDDLHAADPDTVACLLFLLRRLRHERVLIAVTTRTGRYDLAPELAATVSRFETDGVVGRLDVDAFTDDELSQLVASSVGAPPDEPLLAALRERTDGNPFFAIELLDALKATGALAADDGHSHLVPGAEPTLPRTVSTAVLHRVFCLGRDARAVAATASLFGSVTMDRLPLLATLSELDPIQTDHAFDTLVEGRILTESDGGYRFAHPIVRDALYGDIGPAARRRLHSAVAAELATTPSADGTDAIEIAGHLRRGVQGADPTAAGLVAKAGDTVMIGAPAAAIGWYRDALHMLPHDDPGRPSVQVSLSRALILTSQYHDATEVASAAVAALPPGPVRDEAVVIAAAAHSALGELGVARALVERALADGSVRAPIVLLHRALLCLWDEGPGAARRALDDGRAADSSDDDVTEAVVDMLVHAANGDYGAAYRAGRQARRGIDEHRPFERAQALLSLRAVAALEGDPHDALGSADELALAATMPDWHSAFASWAQFRMGALTDAEALARETLGPANTPSTRPADVLAAAALAAARAERADANGAHEVLRGRDGDPVYGYVLDWASALAHLVAGHHDAATASLAVAIERARRGPWTNRVSLLLSLYAEAAWRRGDEVTAGAANDELQSLPHDDGVAATLHGLLTQGLVAADEDAVGAAVVLAEKYGLALDGARGQGMLGAMRDDPGLLLDAYEELDRLGAVFRQREVAHHLRRLGRRVPRRRGRAGELTPVELEVTNLVARGLTNRQVAAAAGLSPKTIEVYLSRIYAKTGYRTRVELAVALARDDGIGRTE